MYKFLKQALFAAALVLFAAPAQTAEQASAVPSLTIDFTAPQKPVSPLLYGLMTEEINYSYDGGLYGELIRNRAFNNDPRKPLSWLLLGGENDRATITLDAEHPLNEVLKNSLRLQVADASDEQPVGVTNGGFWGIPIHSQTAYRTSFYARSDGKFDGTLTLSLENEDGKVTHARADFKALSRDWRRYEVTLKTGVSLSSSKGRFVIRVNRPGTLWFNLVSLFPPTWNDRPNGNRKDIMQLLVDLKPSFLRFPGGNYLQGDSIANRFDWKKTLGDLAQRPGHWGPWGYRSSDGMGLLEFLLWSEDLKTEPILGIYAGCSLRRGEVVPAGPELEPYVQDALDQIEYVIGSPETKWGSRRAADGHPAPFQMTYVEIGNEDWLDKSQTYEARYAQFYDAIKAKYPQLKLIATMPVESRKPDLIDEHIYRDAWQMRAEAERYDTYDRNGPKIFVGEWASRENTPTTSLEAALGDAAWLTGLERNSDTVTLSCYAPLLVNVNPGAMQWKSNLIGYDTLSSYGSPSYYVQKMFAENLGDKVVAVKGQGIPEETWQPSAKKDGTVPPPRQLKTLYYVATRDTKTGWFFLKVVNTASGDSQVNLSFDGVEEIELKGEAIVLTSASLADTNSLAEPSKVIPQKLSLPRVSSHFSHVFPARSITVLRFRCKTGRN